MGDRYRDRIGTKQEWLIVGILLAYVLIPVIGGAVVLYLILSALSWATGISLSMLVRIVAGGLILWGLIRFARACR